jgi:ketosteroid isomerase-like protein
MVDPNPTEAASADQGGSPVHEMLTSQEATAAPSDFDRAIEAFRQGLVRYVTGDARPVLELFSQRDDVTLANPLGPPRRGPAEVGRVAADAAADLRDGSPPRFEEISRFSTSDLGYVVHIERTEARVAGRDNLAQIALRVTMIFRREGDTWKVVHRHADPIMTPRPITTIIEDA